MLGWVRSRRRGAATFGFAVSSAGVSPFTMGVPGPGSNRGSPGGLSGGVHAEVAVERRVLLKEHHHVLDRRRRPVVADGRPACADRLGWRPSEPPPPRRSRLRQGKALGGDHRPRPPRRDRGARPGRDRRCHPASEVRPPSWTAGTPGRGCPEMFTGFTVIAPVRFKTHGSIGGARPSGRCTPKAPRGLAARSWSAEQACGRPASASPWAGRVRAGACCSRHRSTAVRTTFDSMTGSSGRPGISRQRTASAARGRIAGRPRVARSRDFLFAGLGYGSLAPIYECGPRRPSGLAVEGTSGEMRELRNRTTRHCWSSSSTST